MSYIYPTYTQGVSDSFQDHLDRGSVNPGTDYTSAYGSAVWSVSAGTVTDASSDPGGGGGRTVHVDHDDGTGADYLHLDTVQVYAGQWVPQGAQLGLSGASGYGDNWYYGAHLHISFRPNHAHGYGNSGNQDFDAIMAAQGGQPKPPLPAPIEEEEDDPMTVGQVHYTNSSGQVIRALYAPGTAYWLPWQDNNSTIANGFATSLETGASVAISESLYNAMARTSAALLPPVIPAPPATQSTRVSPAQWIIGGAGLLLVLLGLIVPLFAAGAATAADVGTLGKFLVAGGLALVAVAAGSLTWSQVRGRHTRRAGDADADLTPRGTP